MKKNILKIFAILFMIIFLFMNVVQAKYSFIITDGIIMYDYGEMNFIQRIIGFNRMSIPYIVFIIYGFISFIIALVQKNLKKFISFNVAIIFIMVLINIIIKDLFSGIFLEYYEYMMISFGINTLLLIGGLIVQIKKIYIFNKKTIITIVCLITLCIMLKVTEKNAVVNIAEEDWAFGDTIRKRVYSKVLREGNIILGAKILEINDEGILIEYDRGYYTKDLDYNYEYHTEIVQQKLDWGIAYYYSEEEYPMLAIDGGTDCCIQFCK